ncbi:MAG TPA: carbohydrate ABC transporter permease [Clostridia bacterium]|nr:carbohydrate ABC transporter permease [Clostridia bacterium]
MRLTRRKRRRRMSLFDMVVYVLLVSFGLICLLPFVYVVCVSLTDPSVYVPYKLYLIPEKASLAIYRYILSTPSFGDAMGNTLYVTAIGTLISLVTTYSLAYALTKVDIPGRKLFLGIVIFSLLFNAGLVPNFLNIRALGLDNSLWALILMRMTNSWSVLVAKTFLDGIPDELEESAALEGCSHIGTFTRIILPLATASIATLGLFFAVGYWNIYTDAILYITDSSKRTLQVLVKSLLVDANTTGQGNMAAAGADGVLPSETIRMATVVLAILPIMCVYPFLQRFFVKGALLGSVKG